MEAVAVSGQIRADLGKKAAKAARTEGLIPAVIYSKDGAIHFNVTPKAIKSLVYTPDFKVADITLDGAVYRGIVKDIQWHPVTDKVVHLDFLQLLPNHPVKLEVPVEFVGVAPGTRAGGKIQQAIRRVKIKTTPENMIAKLRLDVSNLGLGQSIRVRDIEAIEGVEIMTPSGTPVATIEIPRALRSAAAAEKKAEGEG